MCGIVGYSTSPQAAHAASELLPRLRDTLEHRGPDASGLWTTPDRSVGLAHRRLSTIDLTSAGHQPMRLETHGLTLVLNGEIYNHPELRERCIQRGFHAWKGHSDTEVLLVHLALFGLEATLQQLCGMFAFALHDQQQGTLVLARDRIGEKPLFIRTTPSGFWFASELKALMNLPECDARIDAKALGAYLSSGYVPSNSCILQGATKLQPGHFLVLDCSTGTFRSSSYWQLPLPQATLHSPDHLSLLNRLETLLQASVVRQLSADVPVAVLLSGGVDSSLLTALAARCRTDVNTFSITFPGFPEDEDSHSRLIANHFGTTHYAIPALDSSADLFPVLASQFDEPMADSSMIPTWLLCQQVCQSFKVALGGDGGDELFGGYLHYTRFLSMARRSRNIPLAFRRLVRSLASQLPIGFRGRSYGIDFGSDFNHELPGLHRLFQPTEISSLLPSSYSPFPLADRCLDGVNEPMDLLSRLTRYDALNYLPDDILVKVDRCSMAAGLELRAPFLDHELVEFAFRDVPSCFKATRSVRKRLLKDLAVRVLPPHFDLQRKQGFSIPLASWLQQGPFRDLVHDVLLSSACMFDSKAINGLLRSQDRGFANSERLFALTLFELWRQAYAISPD